MLKPQKTAVWVVWGKLPQTAEILRFGKTKTTQTCFLELSYFNNLSEFIVSQTCFQKKVVWGNANLVSEPLRDRWGSLGGAPYTYSIGEPNVLHTVRKSYSVHSKIPFHYLTKETAL